MQPPSFEEFIKQKNSRNESGEELEPFTLEVCPTPGCKCKKLHPSYEGTSLKGFSCDFGCSFIAKRNTFTGDLICFELEKFKESRFDDPDGIRGMKFNPLGEPYTDWY